MFKLKLEPSGREITFRKISFADKEAIAKQHVAESGIAAEEMLAMASLIIIDSTPVENVKHALEMVRSWDYSEVQYFLEVWSTINLIDKEMRERAQQAAKKLLSTGTTQAPSTASSKPAKVDQKA